MLTSKTRSYRLCRSAQLRVTGSASRRLLLLHPPATSSYPLPLILSGGNKLLLLLLYSALMKRHKKKLPQFKAIGPDPAHAATGTSTAVKVFSMHISESGGVKKRKLDNKVVAIAESSSSTRQPSSLPQAPLSCGDSPDCLHHSDALAETIPPTSGPIPSAEPTAKPKRVRNDQVTRVSTRITRTRSSSLN